MDEPLEQPVLEAEDQARAQWYALISRLFYAPADAELLQGLGAPRDEATARDTANAFLDAWKALQEACRKVSPDELRGEFDALFIGAGKAQVTPYTSTYAAPHAPDRHLVELRTRLSEWGLARRDQVFEVEDHVSAVCDAMRWLIEEGRSLEEQRAFFGEFVDPGVAHFCSAIERSPDAAFYRVLGALTGQFLRIENDAFDLHTAA